MAKQLRPLSRADPLEIDDDAYQALVTRGGGNWSRCEDETEWLAKLHYLREGFRAHKLDTAQYEEREFRLVMGWLRRFL